MKQPALLAAAASLCVGVFSSGCAEDREDKNGSDDLPFLGAAPAADGCAVEPEQLTLMDATQFGVDSTTLLAGVLPLQAQPLYWVAYDTLLGASYTPGVSSSSVRIEISARDNEPVLQVSVPQGCFRASASVSIPVHVGISSADGALAEELDARLMFPRRGRAGLGAFIPARELAGSFAFTSASDLGPLEFKGLSLGIEVWPGGSRGHIAPELFQRGSQVEPDPQPRALTGYVESLTPAVPGDWNLLAVWPRREACLGTVYEAQDRLGGWSLEQVAREFGSRGAGRLLAADGASTPIDFTLEPLSGLICAQEDLLDSPEVRFRVRGRLKAQPGGTGSALDQLDANDTFQLVAHDAGDGQSVDSVQWDRIRTFIPTGETPRDFVLQTGLEAVTTNPSSLFVWSWQGQSTRDGAGNWTRSGKFSVQSAHEVENQICQAETEPPPGTTRPPLPPPSCMTFPGASIDGTLISADWAP